MKSTLGKLIILISICVNLFAQTELANYTLTSNKSELFVKEAVEITFVAHQSNHHDVMYFFLEPKDSKEYKIVLLNKKVVELAYHDKKTTFTFLLFPLQAGKVMVDFDFTIKVASDEAVAQVFQGSRDNVKWIETTNTQINLQPLTLNVQKFTQDVDLVGDFHLTSSLEKSEINSYENANVTYNLNGTGYDIFNIVPIKAIEKVKIFSNISENYNKATADGYLIHREFNYALVSKNNIKIEKKEFTCYSPKNKKFYTISTKEFHVKVTPIEKSTLLDKENYPDSKNYTDDIKKLFIYLLIFVSGFLAAKYLPTSFAKKNRPYQDIRDTHDAKELLFILMHKYDKSRLQAYYELLNDIVYNGANANNFKKIKKTILKALD